MYEQYWRLNRNPFENHADPAFFFVSETHQSALLKIRYLIENRKGAGILVGGTGSGKTCLTHVLASQLAETHGPFVHLVFPQLSPAELLAYLAVELGGNPAALGAGLPRLDQTIREIEQLLAAHTEQRRHPVIIVDEAHLIEDQAVFQALRLLLNFQKPGRADFTLLLAGQRDLLCTIHRLPQLEERLAVKCLLRPLQEAEASAYVSWRLETSGARRQIFSREALHSVFELSGGVPRRINRICDLALLVGYADESESISSEQVEAVSEELTTAVPD